MTQVTLSSGIKVDVVLVKNGQSYGNYKEKINDGSDFFAFYVSEETQEFRKGHFLYAITVSRYYNHIVSCGNNLPRIVFDQMIPGEFLDIDAILEINRWFLANRNS